MSIGACRLGHPPTRDSRHHHPRRRRTPRRFSAGRRDPRRCRARHPVPPDRIGRDRSSPHRTSPSRRSRQPARVRRPPRRDRLVMWPWTQGATSPAGPADGAPKVISPSAVPLAWRGRAGSMAGSAVHGDGAVAIAARTRRAARPVGRNSSSTWQPR